MDNSVLGGDNAPFCPERLSIQTVGLEKLGRICFISWSSPRTRVFMPDLPGTTWNDNHLCLATDESAFGLGLLLLTSHKVFLGAGGEELTWG